MNRALCFSFACLLLFALPAQAQTDGDVTEETCTQTDGEVNQEVDAIITQATDAVRANLATFIDANRQPLATARRDLSAVITRLNREGRDELATSIQRRVNTLEDTVQKRAIAKVPIVQPPQKPLLERIAGKWTHPNSSVIRVFAADGTYNEFKKEDNSLVQSGRITPVSQWSAQVQTRDWKMKIWMSEDEEVMSWRQWNSKTNKEEKVGWVLERVE